MMAILRAGLGEAKLCCQIGQIGCAIWLVAYKAIVEFIFFQISKC
jgi:hypothetical protein